ncbi:hypothetical protein IQ06DRAFT_343251 [Phaeosphaeriaceae sp. SRC1lsM3a]|nr:hypothetical protein IQ06DRAFT_343251 [Stagonospora sp. SRC1lsM3a]
MEEREVRPQRMYGNTIPIDRLGTYSVGFRVPLMTKPFTLESCFATWRVESTTTTPTSTTPSPTPQPQPQTQTHQPRVSNIHALLNSGSNTGADAGAGNADARQATTLQEQPGAVEVDMPRPQAHGEITEAQQATASQDRGHVWVPRFAGDSWAPRGVPE